MHDNGAMTGSRMEFSAKEDIEAPIERVFAVITDFDSVERQALRRGIKVSRVKDVADGGAGTEWSAGFKFRGKDMTADIRLAEMTEPELVVFKARAGGLDTGMVIDLTALSPRRTRMTVTAPMQPKTLSARLLVQSLKLAKGRVTRKFSVRVAQYAKSIEDRAQSAS